MIHGYVTDARFEQSCDTIGQFGSGQTILGPTEVRMSLEIVPTGQSAYTDVNAFMRAGAASGEIVLMSKAEYEDLLTLGDE